MVSLGSVMAGLRLSGLPCSSYPRADRWYPGVAVTRVEHHTPTILRQLRPRSLKLHVEHEGCRGNPGVVIPEVGRHCSPLVGSGAAEQPKTPQSSVPLMGDQFGL